MELTLSKKDAADIRDALLVLSNIGEIVKIPRRQINRFKNLHSLMKSAVYQADQ